MDGQYITKKHCQYITKKLQIIPEHLLTLNFDKNKNKQENKNLSININLFIDIITYVY